MELLISGKALTTWLSTITFKFQYGATNINLEELTNFYNPKFKFQYGATNIDNILLVM